ncbi:MAG: inositol phosphorylceramide synthase [Chitinophagaceae bacterium]|nr:inositol phosphorylceramide synthase [Chitinophagaceae bacterium]
MNQGKALLNTRSIITMLLISVAYLLLSRLLVGYKSDQVFLVVLANVLYFASRVTRKLITGFSIFIVYWVIFDYMKAFPNYEYNQVHIGSLYELEKSIFGFSVSGTVLTPNEYWNLYHNSFLDVLSGIFYLTWVPVPMAFAIYLFFKKKDQFIYFCLSFLLVNLIGFVIYYIYPAAPPWYVQQHGFEFIANTPGNTGGLSRFDAFFHTPVFSSIYEKSSNVFAAMPSLHSSYPVLVLYYGLKNRLGRINILFAILMLGIWFSAVYTSHHYVLDVIAGLCCALTGIAAFKWLNRKGPVRWLSGTMIRATA